MAPTNGTSGDDTINGTAGNDTINGNDGNDSIDGGGGNDSIDGGSGNDTLQGGGGSDTIRGSEGNDSIGGGEQNDSVVGGGGSDTITGDSGADTLDGGDGDDSIDGGAQNDDIQGGVGNDTILGGEGRDSIQGGDDDDSISGGAHDDTVFSGSGNDTVQGGTGRDKIQGGSGNDTIDGGDDEDIIDGGTGDDTLTGGANDDTFVIRDGYGHDVITDFDPLDDRIAFDMPEMNVYQDVLDRMTEDSGDSVITFDNGDTLVLQGVSNASLSSNDFLFTAGPICLLEGTSIKTSEGEKPIETLSTGDLLWTKDHGWQELRYLVRERITFNHRDDPAKPVLFPAGSLGNGLPLSDLITSPQHRICRISLQSGSEVLVPAVKLVGQNGIRRMRGKSRATYLNLVLDRHSLVLASGCWVESLLITSWSASRLRQDIHCILKADSPMRPARRILRRLNEEQVL